MWAAVFLVVVIASLYYCDGKLIYTLDDPYIHLAVAHNILRGGYGINLGEASSPSSSILWPWMLAATEFLRLGSAGPLLLNSLAALATVYVGARLLTRLGLVGPTTPPVLAYGLGALLILVTSGLALPMTGMEHSWHVLTVVLAVDGLIATAGGRPPNLLFLGALVLMPLLRFEGAAFSGATIIALWCLGRRRAAAGTAAALALAGAAYASYMAHLGLPLLPSSVLLKSDVMASALGGGRLTERIAGNLVDSLGNDRGQLLLVTLACLGAASVMQRKTPQRLAVTLPVMAAIAAHLLAGHYGWFARYEVYVMTMALLGLLFAASGLPQPVLHGRPRILLLLLGGLCFAAPYAVAAVETPLAARNIYEQQYQMHRFVADYYQAAVAVNDLGLVSYGNDKFVLDLWGLGSEKVRRLRAAGRYGPDQMARLADEDNVALIMIYENWFGSALPPSWRKIAVLHNVDKVTASGTEVSFFITAKADAAAIAATLERFRQSLPLRTSLTLVSDRRG